MYYVYALQSLKNKNWLYIGRCIDLRVRYGQHGEGKVTSTKKYRPLRLVYYEAYVSKKDATKREYELKHKSQKKSLLKESIKNSLEISDD